MKNLSFAVRVLSLLTILLSSCAIKNSIVSEKNIAYSKDPVIKRKNLLDIYGPKVMEEKTEVFVFIHGGSWKSGDKNWYKFVGKRMAKNGKVAVILNYPIRSEISYSQMSEESAKALKWVKENIEQYGGNPDKIFLSGHSAGGHLAALITLNQDYFKNLKINNPVKGLILIDPFNLDLETYLKNPSYSYFSRRFHSTFSKDTLEWKKASPINYIENGQVPILITIGSKTYPIIKTSSQIFASTYSKFGNKTKVVFVPKKRHIGMIFQFKKKKNPLYQEIIKWMEM